MDTTSYCQSRVRFRTPSTIFAGVNSGPDGNLRTSSWPVAIALTLVPPISTARIVGILDSQAIAPGFLCRLIVMHDGALTRRKAHRWWHSLSAKVRSQLHRVIFLDLFHGGAHEFASDWLLPFGQDQIEQLVQLRKALLHEVAVALVRIRFAVARRQFPSERREGPGELPRGIEIDEFLVRVTGNGVEQAIDAAAVVRRLVQLPDQVVGPRNKLPRGAAEFRGLAEG